MYLNEKTIQAFRETFRDTDRDKLVVSLQRPLFGDRYTVRLSKKTDNHITEKIFLEASFEVESNPTHGEKTVLNRVTQQIAEAIYGKRQ